MLPCTTPRSASVRVVWWFLPRKRRRSLQPGAATSHSPTVAADETVRLRHNRGAKAWFNRTKICPVRRVPTAFSNSRLSRTSFPLPPPLQTNHLTRALHRVQERVQRRHGTASVWQFALHSFPVSGGAHSALGLLLHTRPPCQRTRPYACVTIVARRLASARKICPSRRGPPDIMYVQAVMRGCTGVPPEVPGCYGSG